MANNIVQKTIDNFIAQWTSEHPIVSWAIANPLQSLVIGIVAIFLLISFFSVIYQSTKQLFLFILKAPFELILWIFNGIFKWIKKQIFPSASLDYRSEDDNKTIKILNRLDELRVEQEMLMQELKKIIETQN